MYSQLFSTSVTPPLPFFCNSYSSIFCGISSPAHDLLCPSRTAYRPCLDLSSAFDIIYRVILFRRPQSLYGISGTVLSCFESYLTGRTQTVTVNGQSSRHGDVCFGVPQGSVLGPILFILFSASLCSLTETHPVSN